MSIHPPALPQAGHRRYTASEATIALGEMPNLSRSEKTRTRAKTASLLPTAWGGGLARSVRPARSGTRGGGCMLRTLCIIVILSTTGLAGCVVYEPVPTASPSKFDRSWNAALGAVQDAGVQISSAEPSTGVIRGTKDGIDVNALVVRQADGGVRVQFETKGPTQNDPGLSNRFSQAYERRMGR